MPVINWLKKAVKRSKHGRDFPKQIKTHQSCVKFFETKFWKLKKEVELSAIKDYQYGSLLAM